MRIFQVLLLVLISSAGLAQLQGEALIDSLKKEIKLSRTDSATVKCYLRISDTYIDIDLNKAQIYADSGAVLAKGIKWEEGIAKSHINYGNVYNFTGDYQKALENITIAYNFYKEKRDNKNAAIAAYSLGMSNERMGNYVGAAEKYFEALHIFEKLPGENRLTGNSLSAIAVIYFLQRDYKKSLTYSFEALKKQQLANNTMGVANEYIAIADTYHELSDSSNAIQYNLRALEIQQKLGNKFGQALIYFQLGKLYHSNYGLSLNYHFKAEKLFAELSDSSNFATFNRGEIGKLYYLLASQNIVPSSRLVEYKIPHDRKTLLSLAEQYLQKCIAISHQTGDKDNESAFSATLAELQAYKGEYKSAYLNYRIFHQVQDSIYSQQNKNKIAALESQKELDLKNKAIENRELQLSNQQKKMWLLVTGIAFLVIVGGLLYRQNIVRKRSNIELLRLNQELNEANKIKARFFGILSHDLRSPVANFINFMNLQKRKPGMMSEQEIKDSENKITESAKSLLDTMESVLLWSKGQMEHFQPNLTTVPVRSLFDYLQRLFAGIQHVDITFSAPDNLEVKTDEDYLRTIMHNLTANAVKALEKTPNARIQWKAWAENDSVFLSITDNGSGISGEQLNALYDETTIGGKQGLGLHIIRDLASAIGCNISILPATGNGTVFLLEI